MQRRNFIQLSSILSFVGLAPVIRTNATAINESNTTLPTGAKDRMYWVRLLDKIAAPVLNAMSKGEHKKKYAHGI